MKNFDMSALRFLQLFIASLAGRVAQSVTCLATDACLTADPGVAFTYFNIIKEIR